MQKNDLYEAFWKPRKHFHIKNISSGDKNKNYFLHGSKKTRVRKCYLLEEIPLALENPFPKKEDGADEKT
jgi:hypothetical protein